MPRLTASNPKYQKHRASGQAVVTLDGRDFYLGPHGTQASRDEYDRLVGEWLSQYPTKKMYWNLPEGEQDEDAVRAATHGLLRLKPANVLDFLQHFVVFETKKGKTVKKVARYQQFEAANDIVDRCLELIGQLTKWGNCSRLQNLSFNWRLAMAPPDVMDYLVVHELAHLKEPSHSPRFWLLVRSFCPRYAEHIAWLRANEHRLRIEAC
jgi:hypothetical protein